MFRSLSLGLLVTLAGAGSAIAQAPNVTAGYGVAFVSFGEFNPGSGGSNLALEAGPVFDIFGEHWSAGGRIGTRLHGVITRRPLQTAGESRNVTTWMADAGLMLRPVPLGERGGVAPYLGLGAGLVSYGLGTSGREIFVDEANVVYPGNDQRQFMGVGRAGIDIAFPGARLFDTPFGLRLEAANHIVVRSPFQTTQGASLGPIHNLRFSVMLIGLGWI